ncbi:MAG: N-6 DNA methylase [Candidatus Ancillula sp.]|jgi:methylase of polypeptide subunit release factors|nr:N-6 DNA methylase [Candidatus Ancillula sp.]
MAGILDFDSKKIIKLLDENGIKKTWMIILASAISKKKCMQYILEHENFNSIEPQKEDLIDGLTIGEIGVLYEFSLAYFNSTDRKDKGQFFTPDDVAELMASYSKKFPNGKWLDPCSGIGNLSWHLVNRQKNKEEFLTKNLILADMDELALFIARVLFTLSFQKSDKLLFHSIETNFVKFDFLSVSDNRRLTLFENGNLDLIPEHDFVIVNPPYLATSEDVKFETAKCADLYAYFLENIIKTSKCFISITPQSFTNASKFYSLRKLLIEKFSNLTIYNFDNVPDNIFHGVKFGSKNSNKANSIRSAITIALPEYGKHQITSLLRWQTKERKDLLNNLDSFLSNIELTADYFPKVNRIFESVFQDLKNKKTLTSIISGKKTQYPLYIPASPRYYISALKQPVKRSSIKTVYFNTKKDRELAYIVINSSVMYWWWRVRDGGMTLSLETLHSMPLIECSIKDDIIRALEKSESVNKTYKMNAGVVQENVKHPIDLISRINSYVLPKYSERLTETHSNSELNQLKFLVG